MKNEWGGLRPPTVADSTQRRGGFGAVAAAASATLAFLGCGQPDKPPVTTTVEKATISCVTIARGLMPGNVIDADISASSPAASYGANPIAQTGKAPPTAPLGGGFHEMVLQFDLSTTVPPANTVVQSANVTLWQQASAPAQVQVFPIGVTTPNPWTEAGVSWNVINTPPQNNASVAAFNVAPGQGFTSVTFPLPPQALVKGWIGSTAGNNGILLRQPSINNPITYTQYRTSEDPTQGERPGLVVCFTCAPGFADCDGIAANGCEANLDTDPNNCSACGTACGSAGQCQGNVCNMGLCGTAQAAAGTPCNDGNGCTQTDRCDTNGICVGANPVVCPASQCSLAGACDPSTGTCGAATAAFNGAGCDDGDPCTTGDTCSGGLCVGVGGAPVPARWKSQIDAQGGKTATAAGAAADPTTGNVVLVGSFQGSVDFGGGPVTATAARDNFVVELAPTGPDASPVPGPQPQHTYLWSRHFPASPDSAPSVAVDKNGNVVVAGSFTGTVSFGGNKKLTAAGNGDLFVAKYDKNGNHLWSKHFGVAPTDTFSQSVAFDGAGDVILAGTFAGSLSFGGATLGGGPQSIFVAKLDPAGNHLFSRAVGTTSFAYGLAVDPGGVAVALAGSAGAGVTDFVGPGCKLTGTGAGDAYVALLNLSNLTCRWASSWGSGQPQEARAVAFNSAGDVFLAGSFKGTMDFGGGQQITSAGGYDAFVAGYSGTGLFSLWAKGAGDAQDQKAFGLAVDGSDDVIVGGAFNGSMDFGKGPIASLGQSDGFVAQLDPNGFAVWSQRLGGALGDQVQSVAVAAPTGTVFAAGTVNAQINPVTMTQESALFVEQLGDSACNPFCGGQPNGTACDDGDPCTPNDTCQSGVCVGSAPAACPALDDCHLPGACNLSSGACPDPDAPNGKACAIGNVCYTGASCLGGACYGNAVSCQPVDACHPSNTCDPLSGCPGPAPNGTPCGAGGAVCENGSCCVPTTCAAQGKNCGSIPDGCGGSLNCGTCGGGATCGGGGTSNVCGYATVQWNQPQACPQYGSPNNCYGRVDGTCGGYTSWAASCATFVWNVNPCPAGTSVVGFTSATCTYDTGPGGSPSPPFPTGSAVASVSGGKITVDCTSFAAQFKNDPCDCFNGIDLHATVQCQ